MKYLTVLIVTVAFSLQCEALKCYYCRDACTPEKIVQCGNLKFNDNHETYCTTEIPKDSKIPGTAIRKCQITLKGKEIDCPSTSKCTSCTTDLCNAASPSILGANMALLAAFTKLLLSYM